jgi:hypothetical protein
MTFEEFSPMYKKIIENQNRWAKDKLQTDQFEEYLNKKCYTKSLENNLFAPLSVDSFKEFKAGDGKELEEVVNSKVPYPKIHALHSSSALCVNIFEYWRQKNNYDILESVLGINSKITEIHFEHQIKISKGAHKSSNLDVSIKCEDNTLIAVEFKFSEPFDNENKKNNSLDDFKRKYPPPEDPIWKDFRDLAKFYISVKSDEYKFLDHIQLTKHLFALSRNAKKYRLIYLYYPSDCDNAFDAEIKNYQKNIRGNMFTPISYTELINVFSENIGEKDKEYLEYHKNRYG